LDIQSAFLLPDPAIYAILLVGLGLCVYRPFIAFLFATFLSISVDARTLIHSRLSNLGEFFNLSDACIVISLVAFGVDCAMRREIPKVNLLPLMMVAVLLLGFGNSMLSFGSSYGSLRGLRWGLNLPVLYIVARNLLSDEKRVRQLFYVLIFGATVAEFQHLFLVASNFDARSGNENQLRLIAFGAAHSEAWLVAGPFVSRGRIGKPLLQIALGLLFLIANVTHQTRSLAMAAGGAAIIYYTWLVPGRIAEKLRRFRIVIVVGVIGLLGIIPQLGFSGFVDAYSDRMEQLVEDRDSNVSREMAFNIELDDWMDSNPLIGRGLAYFIAEPPRPGAGEEVAWGHMGYVTYLSQLGLLGFVVYSIWLPLTVIMGVYVSLRRAWMYPEVRHLIALTGCFYLYCALVFTVSGSFLGPDRLPGILGGLVAAAHARALRRTSEVDVQLGEAEERAAQRSAPSVYDNSAVTRAT
jgi:hypothetical protein